MSRNYYKSGAWNVTCDSCSKKIKSTEAKHRWDGFVVCPDCFEHRQPQDFVKARQDKISVPFTRPVPTYVFVPNHFTESINDTVSILEDFDFHVTWIKDIQDTVSNSDSISLVSHNTVADVISTSESIATLVYTIVNISDTVHTAETISASITSKLADNVISTDTTSNRLNATFADTVYNNEMLSVQLNKAVTDAATTSDAVTKYLSMSLTAIDGNVINGDSI